MKQNHDSDIHDSDIDISLDFSSLEEKDIRELHAKGTELTGLVLYPNDTELRQLRKIIEEILPPHTSQHVVYRPYVRAVFAAKYSPKQNVILSDPV